MEITQTRYNTMPEQVQENMDNIKELKKIVTSPLLTYNADIEIATDAGTVDNSNIIGGVTTTENAFILDTVGSLFKIVNKVDTTIYIMHVSSLRGPQGDQGEQGEQGEPGIPLNPYPVNSIYMSVVDTDPSILFGGTWEQIKDTFLLTAGDIFTLGGATGGSATHTHTLSAAYAKLRVTYRDSQNRWASTQFTLPDGQTYESNRVTKNDANFEEVTHSEGYGTGLGGLTDASDNLPPYLVIYAWKRVA